MLKLFVTGDVHIGKKYDRYPEIREKLIQSRFDALERAVLEAEKEGCAFFVVTGDLFDNVSAVRLEQVKQTVNILSLFSGRVLVLPGNHDYYTGEEKLWRDFDSALSRTDGSILLLREPRPCRFDTEDGSVSFYPAPCRSKHSKENALGWIKEAAPDDADFHIGIAHGALAGLTPDLKNEYFLMTERELLAIPMDLWLLGHTHVPYPAAPGAGETLTGYRIFNPGTPAQTDLSNNTPGLCFSLTLMRENGVGRVEARAFQSGTLRFYDLAVEAGEDLEASLASALRGLPGESVLRLTVSGSVPEAIYADRRRLYDEALRPFLMWEVNDDALCERITPEKIRAEFAEIGFAAAFLESLDDPRELQMAYDLVKRHQRKEART